MGVWQARQYASVSSFCFFGEYITLPDEKTWDRSIKSTQTNLKFSKFYLAKSTLHDVEHLNVFTGWQKTALSLRAQKLN